MSQAVLLMSSYTADNIQEVNQRRVESSFEANKIDFISIDGALPENKDIRNTLFGVSEQRGELVCMDRDPLLGAHYLYVHCIY